MANCAFVSVAGLSLALTRGYYCFFVRRAAGAAWKDVQQELSAATRWLLERYPAENGKFIEVSFHDYGPITCASR